jgi:cysteine-S-conjugate beta-lyase
MHVHAESLETLRRRTSEKWVTYPPGVLPLFVAEMDYPLAPVVAQALIERVQASDTGYVASPLAVGEAFAAFAARRWSWSLSPTDVRVATDVSVAIVETLRRVLGPGDSVVVNSPVYPPFFHFPVEAGGVVVDVPLLDGAIDFVALEASFSAGARAYLLCNPHNPLGLVHSRDTLARIADLALAYGVTVVSDEIHAPLAHSSASFVPYLSVSDAARATGIAVTSASKAFNLAGVKCALMVATSPSTRAVLEGMHDEVLWRTSILGLHASVAAFTDGDEYLDGTIAAIESSAALLRDLLPADFGYTPPAASYLAWIRFPDSWGADPAARALTKDVALSPGPEFGPQGAHHARLNLACSPEVLREAVARLLGTTGR